MSTTSWRQCAAEGLDYPRYLLRLAGQELLDRERRATERRIHQARFPVVKSLETFEFAALPSLNKALILEVARCEFIENIIRQLISARAFAEPPQALSDWAGVAAVYQFGR